MRNSNRSPEKPGPLVQLPQSGIAGRMAVENEFKNRQIMPTRSWCAPVYFATVQSRSKIVVINEHPLTGFRAIQDSISLT